MLVSWGDRLFILWPLLSLSCLIPCHVPKWPLTLVLNLFSSPVDPLSVMSPCIWPYTWFCLFFGSRNLSFWAAFGCHACWSRYADWPPRSLSNLLVLCLPLLKNRKANSYIPQSPFQTGFWIWSLFCQLEEFACVFKGRIESEASFFFLQNGGGEHLSSTFLKNLNYTTTVVFNYKHHVT